MNWSVSDFTKHSYSSYCMTRVNTNLVCQNVDVVSDISWRNTAIFFIFLLLIYFLVKSLLANVHLSFKMGKDTRNLSKIKVSVKVQAISLVFFCFPRLFFIFKISDCVVVFCCVVFCCVAFCCVCACLQTSTFHSRWERIQGI